MDDKGEIKILTITDDLPGRAKESVEQHSHGVEEQIDAGRSWKVAPQTPESEPESKLDPAVKLYRQRRGPKVTASHRRRPGNGRWRNGSALGD